MNALQKKHIAYSAATAVATLCILLVLLNIGFLQAWHLKAADALFGGRPVSDSIVIVAIDDDSLQEIGRWPWGRGNFTLLLKRLSEAKAIGIDVTFVEPSNPDDDASLRKAAAGMPLVFTAEFQELSVREGKVYGERLLSPVGIATDDPAQQASAHVFTDDDGITRSIPLFISGEKGVLESFSVALFRKALGSAPVLPESVPSTGAMRINFAGPPGTFPEIPFNEALKEDASFFRGKIVIVGATAPDMHDTYFVPTSRGIAMSGAEIHAHALNTLISREYVVDESRLATSMGIAILAVLVTALFMAWHKKMAYAFVGSLVAIVAYVAYAFVSFEQGTVRNFIFPVFSFIVLAGSQVLVSYLIEKQRKEHVTGLFGRYLSKNVVDHLLKEDRNVELRGEDREISVLFADIRGFTSVSENMTPQQVVGMLNAYFGEMAEVVFKHRGTLDKYIGDCIMAVFNAPLDDDEHAYNCVACAWEMQKVAARIHTKSKEVPKVHIGIGVHSGLAVVGNMGSSQRMDYTAIGDTVNTASRLCSEAGKSEIVISEATYGMVKGRVLVKKLKPVHVKGKVKPIPIYRVVGLKK